MTSIRVERVFHVELCYRVLAHLDLGKDAASLFDRSLPRRPWTRPLVEAYARDPRRLRAQFWALHTADEGALRGVLTRDETELARRFQEALDAEAPRLPWPTPPIEPTFTQTLQTLREALYDPAAPPPLRVLDCRSLGRHGRAVTRQGERVVAVSLGEPPEHALCQLFHEEVHPISDKDLTHAKGRDTRAGSPGHAAHRALEAHAVAVGREVVMRAAPEWLEAYEAWARPFGM